MEKNAENPCAIDIGRFPEGGKSAERAEKL
jgi:hypothetical protein